MTLSRRVSANAAGQIAGRLYTSVLSFLITAVLLPRQLTLADFGIFAFYLALYQLLTNVIDFGAGTIVVRDAARDRQRAGSLLGMLVLIKLAVATLGLMAVLGVTLVFEGPSLRFVLLSLAASHLLFHAPGGAGAIFHVDMDFKWSVLAGVAGQSAWLLGSLGLLVAGVTAPAPYLLAFAAGPVVTGVLVYRWAARRVAIRFDAGWRALAALWREAWPAGASMTLASVYFYVDTAMLRPLQGDVAVGRYRSAYSIMTFALMVPVLFSQVVFPVYSRLWALGARAVAPFHRRTLRLLFTLGSLGTLLVPQIRADVMALVYPSAYGSASFCLGLLFGAVVLVFCAYPHVLLLLASGHQRTMMGVSASAAAFNVLTNLWAIPRHGIEGAAITTVATEAWVLLASAWACRRHAGVRPDFTGLLRPLGSALGSAVVLAGGLLLLPASWHLARLALALLLGLSGAFAAGVLPVDLGGEQGAPGAPPIDPITGPPSEPAIDPADDPVSDPAGEARPAPDSATANDPVRGRESSP